jgi:biotin carboxylase
MEKILFVGAGLFQVDGIKKAIDLGFWTIAIDGNQSAEGKDFAHEFYQIDITNSILVLQFAEAKGIDGVVSIASEVSLEAVALVASTLKLNGYNKNLIDIAHDKKKYYELFAKKGINVPKTYIYQDSTTIKKLNKKKTYFIKPSKGSGSRGVKRTNDIKNFNFVEYSKKYLHANEEIIIQEMVEGKELTIDGFISNKKFHLLAVSEEINDKEKGHTFSSELLFPPLWIQDDHISQILHLGNKLVACLQISCQGPIHLELICNPANEFYIIDFSLRGGGFDLFTKIIEKTSGVDILKLYLNSAVGNCVKIPKIIEFKPVSLSFIYPQTNGIIRSISGKCLEGSFDDYFLKFLYKEGEYVETPESGKQRLAYYICWANDCEKVFIKRDLIRKQISFKIDHE